MRTYGIVAEWNPFHNGHLHLLRTIRSHDPSACIISAMSGPFCQQGEGAIADKWQRAEMALLSGVDLIIELPQAGATSSLETFASAGVATLLALTPLDGLWCGSESGDIGLITAQASYLKAHRKDFDCFIKSSVSGGISYAASSQAFLAKAGLTGKDLRHAPNDRLALQYRLSLPEEIPLLMQKRNVPHEGGITDSIASGSWIRTQLLNGSDVSSFIPETSQLILSASYSCRNQAEMNTRILSALQIWATNHSPKNLAQQLGIADGWETRFYDAICNAEELGEVLTRAQTRAYSLARVRRMILALISPTPPCPAAIPYVRVLGASSRGRALLKARKKTVPVVTRPARSRGILSRNAQKLLAGDISRQNLYDLLLTGRVLFRDYRKPPVILDDSGTSQ